MVASVIGDKRVANLVSAIFSLWSSDKIALESFYSDACDFTEMLHDQEIASVFKNRALKKSQVLSIFNSSCSNFLGKEFFTYCNVVLEKGFSSILYDVILRFIIEYKKLKGNVDIIIRSFRELTQQEVFDIVSKLFPDVSFKDDVSVKITIDETILGGLIVQRGDVTVDLSLNYLVGQLSKVNLKSLVEVSDL